MSVVTALCRLDPEAETLAAMGQRDWRRAVTVLMQAYGSDLYRHCRQMLGDEALAEDVHQIVFVHAYRDIPRFHGRSSLRTWLYGIARHRCLDALKMSRRRRRRFPAQRELPDVIDPAPGADAGVRASELERALMELPPKVRVAVLLRYQDGLSYEEMAEVCGERAPTLQARVARALPRLRLCLEPRGGVS
jgi:RNA polymerase sigma-70 factor (ECF subfamily)